MMPLEFAQFDLPIVDLLPEVRRHLAVNRPLVVQAAPGAGKSTLLPLALLDQPWLGGQTILMLEPRRIAARATAERMAQLLGETIGQTVGYQMRLESRVSSATRILVVTEGILTRRLQEDPALEGVAAVIFDEFHERSVQADLGLALTLQVRQTLRDDLRLVLMSATLEGLPLADKLGAAVVQSEGRNFPVHTHYLPVAREVSMEAHAARVVGRALHEVDGDVLVFLPGQREIRRVQSLLGDTLSEDLHVLQLYGEMTLQEQHAVLRPMSGQRRVILATNLAETSLSIEGVQAVVDSGLQRVAQFDAASAMTKLVTQRISRASAEQRQGRAGRMMAGVCYRLWGESEHAALMAQSEAEIRRADMLPLALELAAWGSPAESLFWLDAPAPSLLAQAHETLRWMAALDEAGRITAYGRELAAMPLHPRLAHVMLRGKALGLGRLACEVAALLAERDVLRASSVYLPVDFALRLEVLRHGARGLPAGVEVDGAALRQVQRSVEDLCRRSKVAHNNAAERVEGGPEDAIGLMLALAYPERLAQSTAPGRLRLASGRAARIDTQDALAQAPWLAVAHVQMPSVQAGQGGVDARVFLAAPITLGSIEQHFATLIREEDTVTWDARTQSVNALRRRTLGRLVLEERVQEAPDSAAVQAALVQGIRAQGLTCLPWQASHQQWRGRVMLLRRVLGEDWPDVSDAALLATLEQWLAQFLGGMSRLSQVQRVDLHAALGSLLDWPQQSTLERLAPSVIEVPSGSRIALDYAPVLEGAAQPVLAVKLQELFGCARTPSVLDGRVPVLIHLLSPAQKPLAVTQDLASFWQGAYQDVRKDMRGRYPKHPWPEDPATAEPTRLTKKGLERSKAQGMG